MAPEEQRPETSAAPDARRRTWRQSANARPEPPQAGLPPQKTPRWLAACLKLLIFPFMMLDIGMQALIRFLHPPPYELKGHCKMRGNCCHYIFMEWPPILDRWPWFGKFWLWWYTDIHGFYARAFDLENDDGRVAKIMSCRHLQPDGRCGSYRLRPAICRQWPRHTYSAQPHILKGCGYFAVPRDDHADDSPGPPEQER